MKYYGMMFKRWLDFKGRSSRAEYWWPLLINIAISVIFMIVFGGIIVSSLYSVGSGNYSSAGNGVSAFLGIGGIFLVFLLVLAVPSLSLLVRRLRDTGMSEMAVWITFSIYLAIIILFRREGNLIVPIASFVIGILPSNMFPHQPVSETPLDVVSESLESETKEEGSTADSSEKSSSNRSTLYVMGGLVFLGIVFSVWFYSHHSNSTSAINSPGYENYSSEYEYSSSSEEYDYSSSSSSSEEYEYSSSTSSSSDDRQFVNLLDNEKQVLTVTATDADGRQMRAELTISNWIRGDKTKYLNNIWYTFDGDSYAPPTLDFADPSTSAYAIGTVELINVTSDFPGASFNGGKGYITLNYKTSGDSNSYSYPKHLEYGAEYGSGFHQYDYTLVSPDISSLTDKDHIKWGPVPVIIGMENAYTPNYPDGVPELDDTVFTIAFQSYETGTTSETAEFTIHKE